MYQARDVMTSKVVTVSSEATVSETIDLLLNHHISGAPVVDSRGNLVGVISEFQLLETIFDPTVRNGFVADFMTRSVISVHEETLLADVATLFIKHRIRRMPVVDKGRLVGIISRSNLLRYVVQAGDRIVNYLKDVKSYAESHAAELDSVAN